MAQRVMLIFNFYMKFLGVLLLPELDDSPSQRCFVSLVFYSIRLTGVLLLP